MGCHPVNRSEWKALESSPSGPLDPPAPNELVLLCDPPPARFQDLTRAGPGSGLPGSGKPRGMAPLFAGGPPSLRPPPEGLRPNLPPAIHPVAQLVRSFFLQAEGFSLEMNLSLAGYGLSPIGKGKYHMETALGSQGRLENFYVARDPGYPAAEGQFGLRIEEVKLRDDRKIILRVRFGPNSFTAQIQEKLFVLFGITAGDLAKVGASPQRVPDYPWQWVDLILLRLARPGTGSGDSPSGGLPGAGFPFAKFQPDLRDSRIDLKMAMTTKDFYFDEDPIKGLYLKGYDLPAGRRYRVEISGPLIPSLPGQRGPVLTLWGGRAIGLDTPRGAVELEVAEGKDPLQFEIELDPPGGSGVLPPALWLLPYQGAGATIQTRPKNREFPLVKLEMTGGVMADDPLNRAPAPKRALGIRWFDQGPRVVWKQLMAHRMQFTGLGTSFETGLPSTMILSNGSMEVKDGRPSVYTAISGSAQGQVQYRAAKKPGEEEQALLGLLRFESLEGKAILRSEQQINGDYITTLRGSMTTKVPLMGLQVRSPKLGRLNLVLEEATMKGEGELCVNITQGTVRWHQISGKATLPLMVEAHGGKVTFVQETAKLRPELKQYLGDELAKKVVSRFHLASKYIKFSTTEIELGKVKQENGVAMLEIITGVFNDIDIVADMQGRFYLHFSGRVIPVDVPPWAVMRDAALRVHVVSDRSEDGERVIRVENIFLEGRESAPTIFGLDRRLCGADRKSVFANVDLFEFGPTRPITIQMTPTGQGSDGPPTRFVVKNPDGGCFVLGRPNNP